MMPDQDRSIFKPNWWLASMIDDKRVGGGNPNAESLRGSHRSVVGELLELPGGVCVCVCVCGWVVGVLCVCCVLCILLPPVR